MLPLIAACNEVIPPQQCLQDPERAGKAFVDLLLARVTSASCSVATRTAAAAYLASFLARAGFLPAPLLIYALQVQPAGPQGLDCC